MLKLYLIICKDRFYLYNEKRDIVYIEANPFFLYESNKIREAAIRLTEKIVDENNLSNKNELSFIVIENSDNVRNESVAKELGNLIVQKYSVHDLIRKTLNEMAKDVHLYISELGINYDGECYHIENGRIWRGDYSLLALSVKPSEIMKFVN